MTDLLPCPFCGGEAEFERYGTNRQSTIVSCSSCGVTVEDGSTWDFESTWNTRTPPDGMVMVPVEPTEKMIDVFREQDEHWRDFKLSYKAMLEAAKGEG